MEITLHVEEPTDENITAIGDGLRDYNDAQREKFGRSEFVITVRDQALNIIGGARCSTGEAVLFVQSDR